MLLSNDRPLSRLPHLHSYINLRRHCRRRSNVTPPDYLLTLPQFIPSASSIVELLPTFPLCFAKTRATAWILHQLQLESNNTRASAMHNANIIHLHTIRQRSAITFVEERIYQAGFYKNFYNSSSPLLTPKLPLIYHPPRLVRTTRVSPSDTPQRSEEWFTLRRDKLTTSAFSTALGFWKGSRRYELWHEKVFLQDAKSVDVSQIPAMQWGVVNESVAIEQYKLITGREVSTLGFATHAEERFKWIGASPDGLLECFSGGGILEVKCPYNKGKPELFLPWSNMPFYYMPQVQGQMEVMGRDWVDLYCWTPNGSTIFRVCRDREYWELIHGILKEFWWENVIPAREALLMGKEEEAKSYKPSSTHQLTESVIVKSRNLAGQARLLCREIAGYVEFYR